MTIQMIAIEQYFPVVLFIMLYKVVQTFEFVDEILKCEHNSNEMIEQSFHVVLMLPSLLLLKIVLTVKVPYLWSSLVQ